MPARLAVHLPFQPARAFLVQDGVESTIGRDPDCDILLDDDRVSRHHARLSGGGDAWDLSDLGSKNGTTVDGRAVTTAVLTRDRWLGFGGLAARFEILSEEQLRRESQRRLDRLQTSLEVQRSFRATGSTELLLERVLLSVLELSGGERAFVLLTGPGGELEIAASAGLKPADLEREEFSGSVGAIERALESRRPVVTSDAQVETFLAERRSVVGGSIRGLVCVPLEALDRLLGAIYVDSRSTGAVFGELDVEILEALASHAALALAAAGLDRELKGLSARLPTQVAAGLSTAELGEELSAARERSFAAPRPGGQPTTWSGLLARHGRRARASR